MRTAEERDAQFIPSLQTQFPYQSRCTRFLSPLPHFSTPTLLPSPLHSAFLLNKQSEKQTNHIPSPSAEKLATQYHTNVFAIMNLTRTFLPVLRSRGGGTIFMIGSVAAYECLSAAGLYDSSKAALKGMFVPLSVVSGFVLILVSILILTSPLLFWVAEFMTLGGFGFCCSLLILPLFVLLCAPGL